MIAAHIALLGPVRLHVHGQPIPLLRHTREAALLAYLAAAGDRAHPRAQLAGLLWPDATHATANNNLRQSLTRLRTLLQDRAATTPLLLADRTTVRLDTALATVDVTMFAAGLAAVAAHAHIELANCTVCLERLAAAVAQYRGPFLHDLALPASDLFEDWQTTTRAHLHHQGMAALHTLGDAHLRRGEHTQALADARRQIEFDPLHEPAQQQVLRALIQAGQRAAATAQYAAYREMLHNELGVEPDASTRALIDALRPAAVPVPISEARSTPALVPARHLPHALTPLIGRADALAQLHTLLGDATTRLITLVGPGGVGKTRLALAAATQAAGSFADGVWWVPLVARGVTDSQRTAAPARTTIANAIVEAGEIALIGPDAVATQCSNALRTKRVLLVLDNVEHLVAGAGFIIDLLQAAPHVQVLITSRERLHVAAEHVLLLDGLPVPPASATGDEARYSAVALFLDRARRQVPGFGEDAATLAAVARVCRVLDGLPLGIELAAQWVADYSCDEIVAAVAATGDFLASTARDHPKRHQSMRAVWSYSWQLLAPNEQHVLARLAVFHGTFDRAAAQTITGAPAATLMKLVDTSLLRRSGTGQYALHELLRQFAAEQLARDADDAAHTRQRYAQYYLTWIAARASDLVGPGQQDALRTIDATIEHVRLAWAWAVAQQQYALLATATPGLCTFYQQRGQYWAGAAACALLIEHLDHESHMQQHAFILGQALAWHAAFAIALSQIDVARATLLRALPLLQVADAAAVLAFVQYSLGCVASLSGNAEEARRWLTMSRDAATRHGDQAAIAKANDMLGRIAWFAGAYAEAQRWYEHSLAIYRALGDQIGSAHALSHLAFQTVLLGQIDAGLDLLHQSQRLIGALGDQLELARVQRGIADVLAYMGRYADAQALLEACVATNAAWAIDARYVQDSLMLAFIHLEQRHYDQALAIGAAILPLSRTLQLPRDTGFALTLLGLAQLGQGAYQQAHATLYEALQAYAVTRIRDDAVVPWVGLHEVYRLLGDQAHATLAATTAVHLAADGRGARAEVLALGAMLGVLLAHNDLERAIELEALVMHHAFVAHSGLVNDLMSAPVRECAKHLPAEQVAAAHARGRARDLHAAVLDLCARYPAEDAARDALHTDDRSAMHHAAALPTIDTHATHGAEQ